MNFLDPLKASCDVPEDPNAHDMCLVPSEYAVGSIVWVKYDNFPAWPAIIDDNPDTKTSIWIDPNQSTSVSKVHVTFFENFMDNFTRAWVDPEKIATFFGTERITGKKLKDEFNIDEDTLESLKRAMREARKASKLNIEERKKEFCFLFKKPKRK